jgi:uncharacterized repeat protein (TIGR01451 family)
MVKRMKNPRLLPLAVVLFLLAVIVEAGQAAGPFSVNVFTDSIDANTGDGVCANATGFCSLRAAIEQANASGGSTTITLPAGTYNLSLGELSVAPNGNQTLILNGAGAATTLIHQNDPNSRVFNIDYGSSGGTHVTLSGMTISGGGDKLDSYGGAGILAGSVTSTPKDTLVLSNCAVSDNHNILPSAGYTSQPGGGVSMQGGDLTVTNCTFTNNTSASSQGGAIAFVQPSGSGPVSVLNISNSTFSGNSMDNGAGLYINGGSAIWINTLAANSGANAHTILHSTFTNNSANGSNAFGGAIYSQVGTTNITYSTFTGNSATQKGGGIFNDSGIINLSYSRLVGNTTGGAVNSHGTNTAVTTATNSWWGCPGGPGAAGCDTATYDGAPSSLVFNPWLTLTNTASPTAIDAMGAPAPNATTLTASFRKNSNNVSLTAAQVQVLLGLPVTWNSAVLGTLSNTQATVQADGTASATFTAGVIGGAGHADAHVDQGVATANISVVPYANLSVIQSDAPDPVAAGNNLTYTILLTNNGPSAASTVTVTGAVPANTSFVSASLPAGWTGTTPAVGGTGSIIFSKASVAAAETASFQVVVKVSPSAANNSTLTGTVTATSPTADQVAANNSATSTSLIGIGVKLYLPIVTLQ